MCLRKVSVGVMAVVMAANLSGSVLAGNAQDAQPCRFLIAAIERKHEIIDNAIARMHEMSRMGSDQDKNRIEAARERFDGIEESARGEYDRVVGNFDVTSDAEVGRVCETIKPGLEEINSRLDGIIKEILVEEAALRSKLAGGKRVAFMIHKTDQMLFRAAQLAKKTGNGEESFPQLRRAYELQEDSKQALAQGKIEKAVKITLKARDIVGETMRAALDSTDLAEVRERATGNLWKGTNDMIARIERNLDSEKNPRVARLVEAAKQEQEKAKDLAEEHPYTALRHAQAARRIAVEILQFGYRAKNCESRVDMLAERIEKAAEIVESSGNEKAVEILNSGKTHYDNGKELCEKGESAKATVQFDIAAKMTAKSVDVANGETRKDMVMKREIKKTMIIVKRAESEAKTEEQKARIENAKQLVQKAEQNTNNPKVCLELLDKATDIAFSVIAETKKPESGESENQLDQ